MLLLAHIDVVEAKREDWTRDPFVLVEENGSFYARGAMDDKAEAAIWVDTLMRYAREKIQAAPTYQDCADLRRRDGRRLQRRGVAGRRITATGSMPSSRSTRAPGARWMRRDAGSS